MSHLEVAGGEPDDAGLVQLTGDGARERQQLGELQELRVLFLPPAPGGVLALLLHDPAITKICPIRLNYA